MVLVKKSACSRIFSCGSQLTNCIRSVLPTKEQRKVQNLAAYDIDLRESIHELQCRFQERVTEKDEVIVRNRK